MVKFKYITLAVMALAVTLSGCVSEKVGTPTPAPTQVIPTLTATATPVVTPLPEVTPTPLVTAAELPSYALYVIARMEKLSNWSSGKELKYELRALKAEIHNQWNTPLSIKAQIVGGDQVLEERNFNLETLGSSYVFTNEDRYFINSTNVTLRLLIQGYQPIEYNFTEVNRIS